MVILKRRLEQCRPKERLDFGVDGYRMVKTEKEWKQIYEEELKKEVEYFQFVSVDTEKNSKEKERFCNRQDRQGKLICSG